MTWLYGQKSRKIEPVIRTQAKDLWRLQAVISKPSSLSALRSGLSLDRAHDISLGDKRRFSEGLTRAKEELQQARGTAIGYQGEDDLFETIQDIVKLSMDIREDMDVKRQKKRKV